MEHKTGEHDAEEVKERTVRISILYGSAHVEGESREFRFGALLGGEGCELGVGGRALNRRPAKFNAQALTHLRY